MRSQHMVSHSEASIIRAVHDDHPEPAEVVAAEDSHFTLGHHIVEISLATELETLQPLQDRKILLLDNVVHVLHSDQVSKQQQAYKKLQEECTVLDTAAYTAIFDVNGNRGKPNAKPMAQICFCHLPARLRGVSLSRHGHCFKSA